MVGCSLRQIVAASILSGALAQFSSSKQCITSLDYIQLVESYRDRDEFATYHLCASRPLQTKSSLFQITKPNVQLVCEGCIIVNSPLEIVGNIGSDLYNVILQGITFQSSSVNIRARGLVTFRDCRFEHDSTLTTESFGWVSTGIGPAVPPLSVIINACIFLVSWRCWN